MLMPFSWWFSYNCQIFSRCPEHLGAVFSFFECCRIASTGNVANHKLYNLQLVHFTLDCRLFSILIIKCKVRKGWE